MFPLPSISHCPLHYLTFASHYLIFASNHLTFPPTSSHTDPSALAALLPAVLLPISTTVNSRSDEISRGSLASETMSTESGTVPWRNVHAWNVLVTFWHPRNVHPTQCPVFTASTVTFGLKVDGLFVHPWTLRFEHFLGAKCHSWTFLPNIFGQPNCVTFCPMATFHPHIFNVHFSHKNCDIPSHRNI